MDSVLIILLANEMRSSARPRRFFRRFRVPDSANLQTKPHVIGYERASRVIREHIWRRLVSPQSEFVATAMPENRARNLHYTSRNEFMYFLLFLYIYLL